MRTTLSTIKWSFAAVTLLLVLIGVGMALGRMVRGAPAGSYQSSSTA